MEERNLELDDDGKIKLKKTKAVLGAGNTQEESDIVIEIPDFDGFGDADGSDTEADNALARRSLEREKQRETRKARAQAMYEEAEKLFAEGDLDGAGEKYLDSAALYGADWRSWFGVVKVQTKDFTEFSGIYDCEQAYDKAFRRMEAEDRAQLAEKYVPKLEAKAAECAAASERLNREDESRREAARQTVQRAFRVARNKFVLFAVLFAVFAAAALALAPFVRSVPNASILIPCIVCAVAALALLVVAAAFLRIFVYTNGERVRNLRAGTTSAGAQARVQAETEELIRSIIDDLKK